MESSVKIKGSLGFNEDILQNFTDIVLCDDEGRSVRSSSVLLSIASQKLNSVVSQVFDSELEVHLIFCGYSRGTVKYVQEFIRTGCITLSGTQEDIATVVREIQNDFSDLGIKTNKDLWAITSKEEFELKGTISEPLPLAIVLKEEYESEGDPDDSCKKFVSPSEDVNIVDREDSNGYIKEENISEVQSSNKQSYEEDELVGPDGMFLPIAFYRFNEQDPKRSEYVCPFCETDLFSKVKDFEAHMTDYHKRYNHMIPKKYACDLCNRQFDTVKKFVVHTSLRACKQIWKLAERFVPVSGSVFENPENFIHIENGKRSCGRQTYFCPLCKETIGDGQRWRHHVKRLHEQHLSCLAKRYKCNGCSKLFTAGHYLKHVKGMACDQPSFCEKCGKSFRNMESLRAHMNHTHSGLRLKCDKCNAVLKNESRLKTHMRTEHAPPVPCEICGLIFKVHLLKDHVLTMHTEDKDKPFQCPMCGRGFGRRNHFDIHVRNHRNEKPFKCFFCDYASSSMGNRQLHMKNVHKEQYLEHKEQQAKKKLALEIDA